MAGVAVAGGGPRQAPWHLRALGRRGGGGWSPRTVTLTLTVLGQAMDDAVREGLLARNVVRLVRRPRRSAPQPNTWTPDEVTRFLGEARRHRLYAAWLLSLMGLRRGEVLGLRWEDLDLDASEPTVTVRPTRVVVEAGRVQASTPKTHRGTRQLPLSLHAANALKDLRALQLREHDLVPAKRPSGHVVVDDVGDPLHPDTFSTEFHRLAERAGVPRIRLHDLRHTALTLMALQGVPMPVVAAWAGHADPAFTLRTYAHSQAHALTAASEALTASWGSDVRDTSVTPDPDGPLPSSDRDDETATDLRRYQSRHGDSNPEPPDY